MKDEILLEIVTKRKKELQDEILRVEANLKDMEIKSSRNRFTKDIKELFNNNLDICLEEFISENNLDTEDIGKWIRKYNELLQV